jgi:hypothetical protein
MTSRLIVLLALFLVLPAQAEETPQFVAARFDANGTVVRFEAPVEIDWQAAAREHFTKFDFERPSEKDVDYLRERIWGEELGGDIAEVKFSFAPPAGGRALSYHLVSAQGIETLVVEVLQGTIRFGFSRARPQALLTTTVFGEAVSQAGVSGGGFALVSRHDAPPMKIGGARVAIKRGTSGVALSYKDDEGGASVSLPTKWHDRFDTAFGIRVGGRRYLFVDWPPDTEGYEALCQNSFALYEVATTLVNVSSNDYDCDL